MVDYYCNSCDYLATRKYDFERHLKTPKHLRNDKIFPLKIKSSTKTHNQSTKSHNYAQNIYECEHCLKTYSRSDSLKRHIDKSCYKYKQLQLIKFQGEQIEELKKQIETLIVKHSGSYNNNHSNNNSNNTTNNTININNYGSEDITHITNAVKTELLKSPYGMIPMLFEKVHFNPEKPENWNIMLVNKKDGYIQVYDNNQWKTMDKKDTLRDLVDAKYFILDEHFENTDGQGLSEIQKQNYEKFQNLYDDDKNCEPLKSKLSKQCEITLLNNRKN
jgi:hypothetical protein